MIITVLSDKEFATPILVACDCHMTRQFARFWRPMWSRVQVGTTCIVSDAKVPGLMGKARSKRAVSYKKKKRNQFSGRKERLARKNSALQEQLQRTRDAVTTLEKSNSLLLRRYVELDYSRCKVWLQTIFTFSLRGSKAIKAETNINLSLYNTL